jgi:hypothetical protein
MSMVDIPLSASVIGFWLARVFVGRIVHRETDDCAENPVGKFLLNYCRGSLPGRIPFMLN